MTPDQLAALKARGGACAEYALYTDLDTQDSAYRLATDKADACIAELLDLLEEADFQRVTQSDKDRIAALEADLAVSHHNDDCRNYWKLEAKRAEHKLLEMELERSSHD